MNDIGALAPDTLKAIKGVLTSSILNPPHVTGVCKSVNNGYSEDRNVTVDLFHCLMSSKVIRLVWLVKMLPLRKRGLTGPI